MQKQQPNSFIFKFIIIGESAVGKSCLLLQFIDNRFRLKHEPTIGVQFGAKTLTCRGKSIKLQVWDTAGQESFRSITRGYYRSAAGAILVYDISNRDSFDNLAHWLLETKTSGNEDMSYVLVGNKCDLQIERKVQFEEGQKFAKDNNMTFLQVSAKTGHNVENAFVKVAEQLLMRMQNGEIDMNSLPAGIKIGVSKQGFDGQSALVEQRDRQEGQNDRRCC